MALANPISTGGFSAIVRAGTYTLVRIAHSVAAAGPAAAGDMPVAAIRRANTWVLALVAGPIAAAAAILRTVGRVLVALASSITAGLVLAILIAAVAGGGVAIVTFFRGYDQPIAADGRTHAWSASARPSRFLGATRRAAVTRRRTSVVAPLAGLYHPVATAREDRDRMTTGRNAGRCAIASGESDARTCAEFHRASIIVGRAGGIIGRIDALAICAAGISGAIDAVVALHAAAGRCCVRAAIASGNACTITSASSRGRRRGARARGRAAAVRGTTRGIFAFFTNAVGAYGFILAGPVATVARIIVAVVALLAGLNNTVSATVRERIGRTILVGLIAPAVAQAILGIGERRTVIDDYAAGRRVAGVVRAEQPIVAGAVVGCVGAAGRIAGVNRAAYTVVARALVGRVCATC